jgi:acylphosphatase
MHGTRLQITGRVQGVGFRYWTHSLARQLGLVGFVRNCPDGSVEVQVSGDREAIAQLRRALERGPRGAAVANVTESQIAMTRTTVFRIIH